MLTTFYPPFNLGGDGIAVEQLARALVRGGHQVTVVHDVDTYHLLGGTPVRSKATDEVVEGVRVVRLKSRLGAISPLLVQQLGRPVLHRRRLRELLAPGNFDVVHYHNVSLLGGPGIMRWDPRAVVLHTAHNFWLVCPTHHLWRYDRELCTARECLRCTLSYRRPPQPWRYTGAMTRALRRVDAVIGLSEFSREKHREFGLEQKMVVLPNLLSVPDPSPSHEPPQGRPYFFFAGRLVRLKGLDDVIPVFREFQDAELVIAGEGAHRPHLEQLAAGAPNIKFLGWLSPDQLVPWYQHARAVLFTSVCWEQFGLVVLEAFAAGAPVIARSLGSVAELVGESGAGELFHSARELRPILERFLTDPAHRREMAERGRRLFNERWSEAAVLPRYFQLIREAAVRRGLELERFGLN